MEEFKIMMPKHPNEEGFVDIDISKWLATDTIKAVQYSAKVIKTGANAPEVMDANMNTFFGTHLRPYIQAGIDKTSYKLLALVECNEVSDIGAFSVEFAVKQH